jgi:iron(III) transport system permease protein
VIVANPPFFSTSHALLTARPIIYLSAGLAGLMALPLLALAVLAFAPGWLPSGWIGADTAATRAHLAATVLPRYVGQSLLLALGVGVGTMAVGVGAAWLVARYEFPGRRVLQWALVLPLAVPGYVVAYAVADFFQFSGPVQTAMRAAFGMDGIAWKAQGYWVPEVRSLWGAVLLFTFTLYPYVYLPVRAAFAAEGAQFMEAARGLGVRGFAAWRRVALPLARPAIAAGVTLALMETLADYGVASYFALETLTAGIYKTWFGLGDKPATAQLALGLLGLVLLMVACERALRGRGRVVARGSRASAGAQRLGGWRAGAVAGLCALPVLLGFVLPLLLLVRLILREGEAAAAVPLASLAWNTVRVSAMAAILTVAVALVMAYAVRLATKVNLQSVKAKWLARGSVALGASGYAVPGAVLAIGLLVPLTLVDRWAGAPWLTGSLLGIVLAYAVRLTAVALNNIEAGLARISPAMDDAAQSLGRSPWARLRDVHFPLLKPSLVLAWLLVFIDALKELPATLILRPFNFDTLATAAHNLAKDERLAEAAVPSLAIVLVSLLPVIWAARRAGRAA